MRGDGHYSRFGRFAELFDEKKVACPFCGDHEIGVPVSCHYLNTAQKCHHYKRANPISMSDVERVDHPPHYGGPDNPYEVIRVLESWFTPEQFEGFLIGNVIKYDARARHKGGDEDHAKALWYQSYLVEWKRRRVAA